MNFGNIGVIGILSAFLCGCVETPSPPSLGGVTGKLTGGLIGGGRGKTRDGVAEPLSPGAAALYTAWTVDDLGRQLDDADRRLAAEADFAALESGVAGVAREWHNGASGRRGQVTPGPAYAVNQYTCRDYVDLVIVETRKETRRSTACRQPDGTWRPIS